MFKILREVDADDLIKCDCCGKSRVTTYHIVGERGNQYDGLLVCRDGLHKLRNILVTMTKRRNS